MSETDRPARAPRGRVVVVGRPHLEDLPQPVVRADNLFDAVGEVTVAAAGEPVTAVVVPSELVRGAMPITVEAFRRIDPSVRLILVAASDADATALGGGTDGFDEVLVEPVSASQLSRAVGNGLPPAPDSPEAAAPAAEALPAAPAAEPPPVPAGELGDTDLVEAILTDPAGVRDLALTLIVQQTGWSDLRLAGERPDDGAACAEARYGPRCYGMLCSSRVDAARLDPWAQWLARWLAMDQRYRDYRRLTFQDELTGAWNRRFYEAFMARILEKAARSRRPVTILVFDIDDFKQYNDRFGHEAGDEVLRETVGLLNSVIRAGDRVCRIGGDEFVVIFADFEAPRKPGSNPPEDVRQIASRFQDQVCRMKFPKLGLDAPGTLSISGGLATFPWDGADPWSLLRHADQLALQSKQAGKNVITLGPGMRREAPPDPGAGGRQASG